MPKSLLMDSSTRVNLTPDGSLATPQSLIFLGTIGRGCSRGAGIWRGAERESRLPATKRTFEFACCARLGEPVRGGALDPGLVSQADSAVIPARFLDRPGGRRADIFTGSPDDQSGDPRGCAERANWLRDELIGQLFRTFRSVRPINRRPRLGVWVLASKIRLRQTIGAGGARRQFGASKSVAFDRLEPVRSAIADRTVTIDAGPARRPLSIHAGPAGPGVGEAATSGENHWSRSRAPRRAGMRIVDAAGRAGAPLALRRDRKTPPKGARPFATGAVG